MTVSENDIARGYRMLLGREPESRATSQSYVDLPDVMDFVEQIVGSSEFLGRMRSPFFTYSACFDAVDTIIRHVAPNVKPEAPYFRNFLGVRMREDYLPGILAGKAGTVEGIPIPANWHADIAEWGAVLRSVDLARDTFTVVELGCGWGCWLNNAGIAARAQGLAVTQIGVEGDEGHVRMARDAGKINGFSPDRYQVHHGLVGGREGTALFPFQPESGINWGLAPVLDASEDFKKSALKAGTHAAVPMLSLECLSSKMDKIDLLHIDIQGGEAQLIEQTLEFLSRKVAYIFVGSHSREIEGRVRELLLGAGWKLEIDRPAIFDLHPAAPHLMVDGAMGWRNPALTPDWRGRLPAVSHGTGMPRASPDHNPRRPSGPDFSLTASPP